MKSYKKGGSCGCSSVQTAGKKIRSSAKRSYRKRVAASKCRGIAQSLCRSSKSCSWATGTRRRFCRKNRNTRRR